MQLKIKGNNVRSEAAAFLTMGAAHASVCFSDTNLKADYSFPILWRPLSRVLFWLGLMNRKGALLHYFLPFSSCSAQWL
jgi:hypothetical protein